MSGSNPLPAGVWANVPQLGAGNLAGGGYGVASGQGASNARPLRGPPASFVRQPYLGQAPAVSAISGFGTGAGAGCGNNGSDFDQSQGIVRILVGLNPSPTSGSIGLMFPFVPVANQYFVTADWAVVGTNIVSTTIILSCNFTRPLVTGEWLSLQYQWTVSD